MNSASHSRSLVEPATDVVGSSAFDEPGGTGALGEPIELDGDRGAFDALPRMLTVLQTPGQVVGEQRFGRLDGYTKLSVQVSTGSNTTLVVFGGLWANGDTWLQVDDVAVAAT